MSGGQKAEKRGLARLCREQMEQLEVVDVTCFRDGLFYLTLFTDNVWERYVMDGCWTIRENTLERRVQTILERVCKLAEADDPREGHEYRFYVPWLDEPVELETILYTKGEPFTSSRRLAFVIGCSAD